MIGRAAQGAPWIFREVNAFLATERIATPHSRAREVRDIILAHLDSLYAFYGEETGVRIARKHLGWYCEQLLPSPRDTSRRDLMAAENTAAQFALRG